MYVLLWGSDVWTVQKKSNKMVEIALNIKKYNSPVLLPVIYWKRLFFGVLQMNRSGMCGWGQEYRGQLSVFQFASVF